MILLAQRSKMLTLVLSSRKNFYFEVYYIIYLDTKQKFFENTEPCLKNFYFVS